MSDSYGTLVAIQFNIKIIFMKKLLLVLVTVVAAGTVNAQELGIRFGGISGSSGAALDAVFGLNGTRIHADLGFYEDAVGIDFLWDLIYKPLGGEAFYWYLGVGPTAIIGDVFRLGVAGEIGLEYLFNTVPIAIGADWRPSLWIVDETRFGSDSFGLNVRWRFGSY